MDKARVYGTRDSRFDPWQDQFTFFLCPDKINLRVVVSATPWRSFTPFRAVWRRQRARKEAACDVAKNFLVDNFSTDSRTMISPVLLLPNSIRFRMASSYLCLFCNENARTFRGLTGLQSNRPREPRPQCRARSQGRTGTSDRWHPPNGAKCPPHRRWDTYSEPCVPSVYSATFQLPTQISTPSP